MDIALIYSVMNDRDKAFEWLEKAYDERNALAFRNKRYAELQPIKDDPRFQDLLSGSDWTRCFDACRDGG
jgi:hypothetical protein